MTPRLLPHRLILGYVLRIALFLGSPILVVLSHSVHAAVEQTTPRFDIAAGDAATTLRQFAAQVAERVVFAPETVRGVMTNAIKGEFTPRAALDGMLANTSLVSVPDTNTGALAVRRRERSPSEENRAAGTPNPLSD